MIDPQINAINNSDDFVKGYISFIDDVNEGKFESKPPESIKLNRVSFFVVEDLTITVDQEGYEEPVAFGTIR